MTQRAKGPGVMGDLVGIAEEAQYRLRGVDEVLMSIPSDSAAPSYQRYDAVNT